MTEFARAAPLQVQRFFRTHELLLLPDLTVIGNRSEQDENYGILMNYITYSTLRDNFVSDVRDGSTGDTMITGARQALTADQQDRWRKLRQAIEAAGITVVAPLDLMDEIERDMDHLDENNPRHMAHLLRKMQQYSMRQNFL